MKSYASLLIFIGLLIAASLYGASQKQKWFKQATSNLPMGWEVVPGTEQRMVDGTNPATWFGGYISGVFLAPSRDKGRHRKTSETGIPLAIKMRHLSEARPPEEYVPDEFWVVYSPNREWSIMEGEPPLDGQNDEVVDLQLSKLMKAGNEMFEGKRLQRRLHDAILDFVAD